MAKVIQKKKMAYLLLIFLLTLSAFMVYYLNKNSNPSINVDDYPKNSKERYIAAYALENGLLMRMPLLVMKLNSRNYPLALMKK